MKSIKNTVLVMAVSFAAITVAFKGYEYAPCKVKSIVKSCMPSLGNYHYDAYALKEINYGPKTKKENLEFAVYSDEEYKLVFGKTELPQEIGIKIFDKNPKSSKAKLIYFDESGKKDDFVCTFKPTTTGNFFIEFEIPAASAPNQSGCFVVLIGIKD